MLIFTSLALQLFMNIILHLSLKEFKDDSTNLFAEKYKSVPKEIFSNFVVATVVKNVFEKKYFKLNFLKVTRAHENVFAVRLGD